jgi:hypothetical protein
MTLPSSGSRIWLYNIDKVSVLQISSLPKLHISFRSRMIKKKANIHKYALVRNHLQIQVTWENHSRNKSYIYIFKTIQKLMFLSRGRVRRLESKLFHFSISKDNLVDTQKFIGSGETWNKLYEDFKSRRWTRLVLRTLLEDEQRTKCGAACWLCLTHNYFCQ